MSSILLSNSSIPFSMSTCSTLEVYYLKVTRKYLPYSDGSFASSVFESFISFFKALYFLNSWPSCKFFKNVWTVFFWMENCIYSDMENKTICGPAFHVCAPYRCKYKSLRDICVYSDMENKMTEEWMLIKNISCGVSSKVKRHEFSMLMNSNGFLWCVRIFDGDNKDCSHWWSEDTVYLPRTVRWQVSGVG